MPSSTHPARHGGNNPQIDQAQHRFGAQQSLQLLPLAVATERDRHPYISVHSLTLACTFFANNTRRLGKPPGPSLDSGKIITPQRNRTHAPHTAPRDRQLDTIATRFPLQTIHASSCSIGLNDASKVAIFSSHFSQRLPS
jgi:hypothetical protein